MVRLAPTYPIRSQRLDLRPVTPDDVEALFAYQSRPDVVRHVPYEPRTRAELAALLAEPDRTRSVLEADDQALDLAVVERASGTVIGQLLLFLRSIDNGNAEIGWVLNPEYGGRGYATEAARAVLDTAFGELGLRRVIARLDARNVASARVCERLGMRLEARLVRNEYFKGELCDELDYAVLSDEWPAFGADGSAGPSGAVESG